MALYSCATSQFSRLIGTFDICDVNADTIADSLLNAMKLMQPFGSLLGRDLENKIKLERENLHEN